MRQVPTLRPPAGTAHGDPRDARLGGLGHFAYLIEHDGWVVNMESRGKREVVSAGVISG